MERRRFLTLAGTALVVAACDTNAPPPSTRVGSRSTTPRPTDAVVTRWATDPWSRGSYSYLAVGSTPSDRDSLRADVDDRIFFAGEATSTSFPATAHGALMEGRDAAARIASAIAAADGSTEGVIVVVGAGIAGLGAARALNDSGHRVIVVEARDRVGGRIHTTMIGSQPVDLGASWIHGVDVNPLTDLAVRAGLRRTPTDYDSIVVRNAVGVALASSDLDRASELLYEAVVGSNTSVGGAVESLLEELDADERDLVRYALASEIEHEFAADGDELSIDALDEGEEYSGGDALLPAGFDRLLTPLLGGYEVYTSTPVTAIAHGPGGVVVTTADLQAIAADRVLVTVPLGVLQARSITFDPPLHEAKQQSIDRLGMGVLEKVVLRYDAAFWDSTDLLGHVGDEPGHFVEWLNLLPSVGAPVIVGFNAGSVALELLEGSDVAVVERATNVLSTMYP